MPSEPLHKHGLISFMYWVLHDRQTNQEFHGNEAPVMDRFGLDIDEQKNILAIGKEHADPRTGKVARKFFNDYLLGPFLEIWADEITSSISASPRDRGWTSFMYYARHDRGTNASLRQRPDGVLRQFDILGAPALRDIEVIARDPRSLDAICAAYSIFNNHIVDEILGTASDRKFW